MELQDSGQGCCCPPELPRLSGGVILSRIGFLVAADGQCVRSRDKLVVLLPVLHWWMAGRRFAFYFLRHEKHSLESMCQGPCPALHLQ